MADSSSSFGSPSSPGPPATASARVAPLPGTGASTPVSHSHAANVAQAWVLPDAVVGRHASSSPMPSPPVSQVQHKSAVASTASMHSDGRGLSLVEAPQAQAHARPKHVTVTRWRPAMDDEEHASVPVVTREEDGASGLRTASVSMSTPSEDPLSARMVSKAHAQLRELRVAAVAPFKTLRVRGVAWLSTERRALAALWLLVAVSYVTLTWLCVSVLSYPGVPDSPVWFGSALAICFCWVFGVERAFVMFTAMAVCDFVTLIGAFGATPALALPGALLIATGHTFVGVFVCTVCRRYDPAALDDGGQPTRGAHPFAQPASVLLFAAATAVSTFVSAAIGTSAFLLVGGLEDTSTPHKMLMWFVGNFCGTFVLAPLILGHQAWLVWDARQQRALAGWRAALQTVQLSSNKVLAVSEVVALSVLLGSLIVLDFAQTSPLISEVHVLVFLVAMVTVSRTGWIGANLCVLVSTLGCILFSVNSRGPFVKRNEDDDVYIGESVLNMALFIATLALVVQFTLASRCARAVLEAELEQRVFRRTKAMERMNVQLRLEKQHAERARDRANRAAEAKSRFLNAVSHEMRTPLHGLRGNVELLHETSLTAEQWELLDTVSLCSNHLLRVINDVLDLSKLMSGEFDLETRPFDLVRCIDSVVKLSYNPVKHSHIEFAQVLGANVPRHIVGDDTRIRQVLVNLCSNALKFTAAGSVTIKVRSVVGKPAIPDDAYVAPRLDERGQEMRRESTDFVGTQGTWAPSEPLGERRQQSWMPTTKSADCTSSVDAKQYVLLSVTDTGIGMPAEKLDKLFRPFSQVHDRSRSPSTFKGTGLGLAISAKLVQCMGGAVWVTSTFHKGSTFTAAIPLTEPVDSVDVPASPATKLRHLSLTRTMSRPLRPGHVSVAFFGSTPPLQQSVSSALRLCGATVDVASKHGDLAVDFLARAADCDRVVCALPNEVNHDFEQICSLLEAFLTDDAAGPFSVVLLLPGAFGLAEAELSDCAAWKQWSAAWARIEQRFPTANRTRVYAMFRPLPVWDLCDAITKDPSDLPHKTRRRTATRTLRPPPKAEVPLGSSSAPLLRRSLGDKRGSFVRQASPAPLAATTTAPTPTPSASGARRARVLVADDNSVNRRLIQRHLSKLSFVDAEFAVDGGEVVDKALAGEPFDVILMDIQMPKQSGMEAAHEIRAHVQEKGGQQPLIVAMTANVMQEEMTEYLTLMDDTLPKPFSVHDVRDLFERLDW